MYQAFIEWCSWHHIKADILALVLDISEENAKAKMTGKRHFTYDQQLRLCQYFDLNMDLFTTQKHYQYYPAFREWMRYTGTTKYDIAALLDMSARKAVFRINGRCFFSFPQLRQICNAYNLPMSLFMADHYEPEKCSGTYKDGIPLEQWERYKQQYNPEYHQAPKDHDPDEKIPANS